MYESLLCLPYFQGMSKDNITSILGKVSFEFKHYNNGETIFTQGESCQQFAILTQGEATCTSKSPDGTYSITENIAAPSAIEPCSLFGYDTTYKSSYTAIGECTVLHFSKQHLLGEFSNHGIFSLNLLNIISHKAQQQAHNIWSYNQTTIHGRIARFIAMRCNSPKGEKHISIKMERLATLLCETRLNISKALNEMQEAGHLTLHRGGITVHTLQQMLNEFE